MTTPTPERALELAAILELGSRFKAMQRSGEIAAILRHYAEIAPKYQAVLDAEPVAYRFDGGWAELVRTNSFDYHEGQGLIVGGQPLIIKPTQ